MKTRTLSVGFLVGLLTVAQVVVAQRTISSIDEIDLRPPIEPGNVERVAVTLPILDASESILVTESRQRSGAEYTFTNTSDRVVWIWRVNVLSNARGELSSTNELGTLSPGQSTSVSLSYSASRQGPYGQFRVFYCVAFEAGMRLSDGTYTREGEEVIRFTQAIQDKVVAEASRFVR